MKKFFIKLFKNKLFVSFAVNALIMVFAYMFLRFHTTLTKTMKILCLFHIITYRTTIQSTTYSHLL